MMNREARNIMGRIVLMLILSCWASHSNAATPKRLAKKVRGEKMTVMNVKNISMPDDLCEIAASSTSFRVRFIAYTFTYFTMSVQGLERTEHFARLPIELQRRSFR